MQPSALAKRAAILLLPPLLTGFFYFFGLGLAPLLGPDEPRYAQVAREMMRRGDAVTPTLGGHTWFEKPALPYWAMIVSYRLFGGVSEYAARWPSACAGLLTVMIVALLGRSIGRETEGGREGAAPDFGFVAGAALASSAGMIAFSRAASFDIYLTAAVTLALGCFLAAERIADGGRRRLLLAGFYGGTGLALLAKGLIGAIIPGGVIVTYWLLARRRARFSRLGLPWGVPLALAVAALWYAPVIRRHGWPFVDEFFLQHHFARYTSNKYHHPQPFYFYLWVAPLLALPWTLFLGGGLWRALGAARRNSAGDQWRVFVLAWAAFPIVFFSLSGSKLPGYILPSLPPLALLAAGELSDYVRGAGGRNLMRTTGAVLCAAALGGLAALGAVRPQPQTAPIVSWSCAAWALTPILIAGLAALALTRRAKLCVVAITIAAWACVAVTIICALRGLTARESIADLLQIAGRRGYGTAQVVNLHTVNRSAEFYAADKLLYDARGEPLRLESPLAVIDLARRNPGAVTLVVVPVEHAHQMDEQRQLGSIDSEVLGDNGEVALVAIKVRN